MARWAVVLFLVLLLAITIWIQTSLQEEGTVKVKDRGRADSVMWDFKRTDMDENGIPKAQLKAELMKHYPLDDSVELERPMMEIYNGKGVEPWYVTAESGWLSGDGEKLLLYGEVFIWRNKGVDDQGVEQKSGLEDKPNTEKEIELITTDLKILIKEEYAETSNFVTIINGQSRVTATGLQANLKKRNLKLLENVRGRYENSAQH